jgi:hypothetical protein
MPAHGIARYLSRLKQFSDTSVMKVLPFVMHFWTPRLYMAANPQNFQESLSLGKGGVALSGNLRLIFYLALSAPATL